MSKKKALRYGRPANAKTFWQPKTKVVEAEKEDDSEWRNRKYMRETFTIHDQNEKQAN